MFNPPHSFPNSDPYDDLKKRMTQHMQENRVDNHILELLQNEFEKELSHQNIILSRSERARLFRDVAAVILQDVLSQVDDVR